MATPAQPQSQPIKPEDKAKVLMLVAQFDQFSPVLVMFSEGFKDAPKPVLDSALALKEAVLGFQKSLKEWAGV